MTTVNVAMLGARRHYAIPRLLYEAGLLGRFFTDSYSGNKPRLRRAVQAMPDKLRPASLERWLGRADTVLPPERVVSFEGLGWWYALQRHRAGDNLRHLFDEANQRFNQRILAHRDFATAEVVWGFNSASSQIFRAAKEQGKDCVLEQTSYPNQFSAELLDEQLRRWPGWAQNEARLMEVTNQLASSATREAEEWAMADRIVCGSEFVRDGLIAIGVSKEKLCVVPYGYATENFSALNNPAEKPPGDHPAQAFRVLFAGRVSLWKGAPDLLEALKHIPQGRIEARFVGRLELQQEKILSLPGFINFLGAVPRSRMADLYRWADVFVLPSISEGSAGVTYEALMSGVPVIATKNAGSPVRDGVDGYVVPSGDSEALAMALQRYLDDPALLRAHREAAIAGRHRISLDAYRDNLSRVIQSL
jgi:hypothetical protein